MTSQEHDGVAGAGLQALDRSATALLLVDMQRDYLVEDGYFARNGADVGAVNRIVPLLTDVLAAFRAAEMPVVHTQFSLIPGLPDIPELHRVTGSHFQGIKPERLVRGERGVEFISELAPREGEHVIIKPTIFSGFVGTELEIVLRRRGIKSLVVGGIASHACVLHTCYDAFARDFDVAMLSDGTATFYAPLQAPVERLVEVQLGICIPGAAVVNWVREGDSK